MPLYEYICEECKYHFEKIRSFSQADQVIPCQVCGSTNTKRALSHCNAHIGKASQGLSQQSSGCRNCSSGNCGNCRH